MLSSTQVFHIRDRRLRPGGLFLATARPGRKNWMHTASISTLNQPSYSRYYIIHSGLLLWKGGPQAKSTTDYGSCTSSQGLRSAQPVRWFKPCISPRYTRARPNAKNITAEFCLSRNLGLVK